MLSLLRAAGLEERDGFAVFVRDIPWAMPLDMPVALQHGDLIQVLPVSHDEVATFSLPDMLSSTEGWDTAWLPPGEGENNAWVLARLENFTFRIAPFRSLQVRADLALRVGTPESNLIVCPTRPQVDNLAFRGRMSRNILVAIAGEHGRHYSQPRLTICILDLRAILQGFSWYALPDGILHHDRVASRFGPRCPEGYSLGRLMPDGSIRLLQEPISVHDGEVVCLTFFIPPPENLSSSEYSSDESDNGGSDHEGMNLNAGVPTQGTRIPRRAPSSQRLVPCRVAEMREQGDPGLLGALKPSMHQLADRALPLILVGVGLAL